jgi:hypothetical protein
VIGAEDSPEPAVLLARIYAHVMYRIPVVRSVAKRLEGQERKAGLGSDAAALVVQLYLRNREQFATFRAEAARSMAEKRAERESKAEQGGAVAASVFQFKSRGGRSAAQSPDNRAERSA